MDNGSIVESIFFFEIKIKNDLQSRCIQFKAFIAS